MKGLADWLRPYAEALVGYFPSLTVSSTYRSITEQIRLWYTRATNPYPVAYPGTSWHQYRRAFDLNGDLDTLYAAGAVWKSWGGTWSPKDPIHFQA